MQVTGGPRRVKAKRRKYEEDINRTRELLNNLIKIYNKNKIGGNVNGSDGGVVGKMWYKWCFNCFGQISFEYILKMNNLLS